jgi:hypothetical protein
MLTPLLTRNSKKACSILNGLVSTSSKLCSVRLFADNHRLTSAKTLQYQDKLGHLPVPDLQETMARFLKTAEPHLTEAELKGRDFFKLVIWST